MRFWWAWWLAGVFRVKRKPKLAPKAVRKAKPRPVPAYRRADGTDDLRRIH